MSICENIYPMLYLVPPIRGEKESDEEYDERKRRFVRQVVVEWESRRVAPDRPRVFQKDEAAYKCIMSTDSFITKGDNLKDGRKIDDDLYEEAKHRAWMIRTIDYSLYGQPWNWGKLKRNDSETWDKYYWPDGEHYRPHYDSSDGIGIAPGLNNNKGLNLAGQGASVSPIILDLDGDGVETTSVLARTYFDSNGDGFAEQTGWVDKDDALLVRDLNGNGVIDSGAELFGSNTLLNSGRKSSHGGCYAGATAYSFVFRNSPLMCRELQPEEVVWAR